MRRPVRSAEQFAAALDSTDVAAASEPALSPLLALAQQLQAMPLGPSDDFRASLRTRLMAVAAVAPAEVAVPSPADRARAWVRGWRVQRGLAAATASMAAVISIAGVSTAGMRSLPGDPFYSVKRTAESVQLAMTRGDVPRGKRHLAVAETRLDEVAELVGDPSAAALLGHVHPAMEVYAIGGSTTDLVRATLADMDDSTRVGTRLLTEAYRDDRETEPLKALASFVRRQKAGLAEVIPSLPADARDAAADSLQLVAEVETRANALLTNGVCGPDCAPAPVSPTPEAPEAPVASPAPPPAPDGDGEDDLGPAPCDCASPSPQPQPQPTSTSDPRPQPQPTATSSPSPQPSPSDEPRLSDLVPTLVPAPVRSPVVEVIDTVEDLLPTPAPVPVPAAAPAPAAPPASSGDRTAPEPAAGVLPAASAQ